MKTPEEVLKDLNITPETKYHSWEYVYDCFIDIINKTLKNAWNEAVDACAESADCLYFGNPAIVDKQSILKLKK